MIAETILIVDDEQRTRQGLKKTLDQWAVGNYEILTAEDGKAAWEIFRSREVHLLITDICMPEMNGLQLLKTLRTNEQKTVVLILSGYPDFEYVQEAIRLGVVNYLLKPTSKKKLIEAVEQALEIKAANERIEYIQKVADPRILQMEENTPLKLPIKKAIQYIHEHLNDSITLKRVADHVHLNATYFSALFKEQTGLNFSEYLTRKRLELAKSLLLTSSLTVDEISRKSGYQTPKYFIKVFKDYEGVTPSKYRKSAAVKGPSV